MGTPTAPSCSQSALRTDRAQPSKQASPGPRANPAWVWGLQDTQLQHRRDSCDTANPQLASGGFEAEAGLISQREREGGCWAYATHSSKAKREGTRDGNQLICSRPREVMAVLWSGFPSQVVRAVSGKGVLRQESHLTLR